jgi:hypothetical protein
VRHWLVLVLFLLGLGTLRIVACGDESCVEDKDCNDGNPCTSDRCPEPPLIDLSLCEGDGQTCQHSPKADGTPCDPADRQNKGPVRAVSHATQHLVPRNSALMES